MHTRKLSLTLIGRYFSMMPKPQHLDLRCTSNACADAATHRVLSRATASVEWLCDDHTLAWARDHGCEIPTVTSASV
jgi:hypothetical protein